MNFIEIKLKEKQVETPIFITDNAEIALHKLKCFAELNNKERLAYANHIAELFEMIGDDAFRNIGFIFKQFVFQYNNSIIQSKLNDSYSVQIAMIK